MPRTLHCWRCDLEVPMLDEDEWATLAPLLVGAISDLKETRLATGMGLAEARASGIFGARALARYRELTGFDETNLNAL